MDVQVSALAPFGLGGALPLGDVRPKWASSVQPWWDLDCDRDLLLGTFLHGFGAYPKMKADPRLCFTAKVCMQERGDCGVAWGAMFGWTCVCVFMSVYPRALVWYTHWCQGALVGHAHQPELGIAGEVC